MAQTLFGGNTPLFCTASDPFTMARVMRELVYDIDPDTAVDNVQTLEQVRSESLSLRHVSQLS